MIGMSGCKPAHFLANAAKEIRDALVHPSPFIDPKTLRHTKFLAAVPVNLELAQELLEQAVSYAEFVEKGLGNDSRLTAPWLLEKHTEPGGASVAPRGSHRNRL